MARKSSVGSWPARRPKTIADQITTGGIRCFGEAQAKWDTSWLERLKDDPAAAAGWEEPESIALAAEEDIEASFPIPE